MKVVVPAVRLDKEMQIVCGYPISNPHVQIIQMVHMKACAIILTLIECQKLVVHIGKIGSSM